MSFAGTLQVTTVGDREIRLVRVLQSGMKEGMAMGYDRLEEFMASRDATS